MRHLVKVKPTVPETNKAHGLWYDAWLRLRRNKLAMLGLGVIIVVIAVAIFAPDLAQFDPTQQLIWTEGKAAQLAPPSDSHWFGTDIYGRDIFARVIYGSRVSLQIAIAAMGISVLIGTALGALAGYYSGWLDEFISWLMNVIYAFPFLLFIITVVAFLPPSLTLVYVAIGLISWVSIARVVRGQVLTYKNQEFVESARALGVKNIRLIFYHILPNVIAPVIVQATLGMGTIIMTEAALSYLGFGTQPPTPSWGLEISMGQDYLLSGKWWWSIFPGIAICLTVLGFNLLGDGLRDALDPRLKQ